MKSDSSEEARGTILQALHLSQGTLSCFCQSPSHHGPKSALLKVPVASLLMVLGDEQTQLAHSILTSLHHFLPLTHPPSNSLAFPLVKQLDTGGCHLFDIRRFEMVGRIETNHHSSPQSLPPKLLMVACIPPPPLHRSSFLLKNMNVLMMGELAN